MIGTMNKQPDEKSNVIDLSTKRKQQRYKAKNQGTGSDDGFDLKDLSFQDIANKVGRSRLGTIFQFLVFMVVLFFFMRSCGI